jgi:hypothetical protein
MYRSSRLFLKGTGAPFPTSDSPHTNVRISGRDIPVSAVVLTSMTFGYRWREKDYGDEYIEDWCFDVQSNTNIGTNGPSSAFWRNWVYIGKSTISFGCLYNSLRIETRGEDAYLVVNTFTRNEVCRLACSFQEVVEIFKGVLIPTGHVVQQHDVYKFPIQNLEGWNSLTVHFD